MILRVLLCQLIHDKQRAYNPQHQKPELYWLHSTGAKASEIPAWLSQESHAEVGNSTLDYRNESIKPREKMKTVMREPHGETERHKAITVPGDGPQQSSARAAPLAAQPCRSAQKQQRFDDQESCKNNGQRGRFMTQMQPLGEPVLNQIDWAHHAKRVQESAKRENDGEDSQIRPAREIADSRTRFIRRHQLP